MSLLLLAIVGLSVASAENAQLQAFITANNLFTPSVYKEISKTIDGNFLVSPFSAETALAFAQSGCRGQTASEIRSSLHLPENNDEIEAGVKALLPKIKENNLYTLHTANKMYVKEGFSIKESFKKVATEVYGASSEYIDFTKSTEAAATMNKWVEGQTENKIKNLISPDLLNELTRAVLINALYFRANWSNPFDLYLTEKKNFYKTASDVIQVDTMSSGYANSLYVNYYECPHLNAKFVELPFKSEDASMTIVLPNEKEGLATLENQLDRVFNSQHNFTRQPVIVSLPKFKIETSINLKEILMKLGVRLAFTDHEADLSGIAGKKGDLVINEVEQKTFIDVTEEGVEAAAATYVIIAVPISGLVVVPKQFIADHPFIFFIKVKEAIIFAGRVTEPISSGTPPKPDPFNL